MAILVFTSLQPFYEGVTADSFGRFTLENFWVVLGLSSFHDAILNTLVLGTATSTIVVPFTALCAWLAVRRYPGAWLLDQIAMAPLVFPAIVMSVAFLHIYVNMPFPIYGTLVSVIIASAVRYLPYGMRYSFSGILQIHPELEQAAGVAGASRGTMLRKVVFPLLWPAMSSGWLFIFLLCAKEMSLPLLLAGPNSQTISVAMFDLWSNGQGGEVAALGLIWAALMTAVAATFHVVMRRQSATTFGH